MNELDKHSKVKLTDIFGNTLSVDPRITEIIKDSRHGFRFLSSKERKALERARLDLLADIQRLIDKGYRFKGVNSVFPDELAIAFQGALLVLQTDDNTGIPISHEDCRSIIHNDYSYLFYPDTLLLYKTTSIIESTHLNRWGESVFIRIAGTTSDLLELNNTEITQLRRMYIR